MSVDLRQLSHTLLPTEYMQALLHRCIEEDGGLGGDVTSSSIIPPESQGRFSINVRGCGTIAGLEPISRVIAVFGDLRMELTHQDGDRVQGEPIATLSGAVQSMLIAERTLLNMLGHASGIATQTRLFVDEIAHTDCLVCDTRKTTPGLRMLDKYAVACGGGTIHRLGLHDAALYKDNHLAGIADISSSLGDAIEIVRQDQNLQFVEVEVDTLEHLARVLELPVDIILLDNMSIPDLERAVSLRDESDLKPLLEASGGITIQTVRDIASTGVDRIAVGSLTHQSCWVDIGLDAIDA